MLNIILYTSRVFNMLNQFKIISGKFDENNILYNIIFYNL